MDRSDYPDMLAHLQPAQAVKVLNDRLRYINRLNVDVADWLLERRRIEETYALSLRKLAGRQLTDPEIPDLGIFSTPWQKITSSIEVLAKTHHNLAQNIGVDVEVPLREWASRDRQMTGMSTITGNIQAIARELENAQKKSDKLSGKGGKADADKVANAATGVESALSQWESQAPYVFEQLQAVDEARVDNMRNVLTQYQTHIIEAGSSLSRTAEDSLNALLNVQTEDEIKTFVLKSTKFMPTAPRRQSRQEAPPPTASSATNVGSSLAPIPSGAHPDDRSSHRSNSFQDRAAERPEMPLSEKSEGKSGRFGLKRLGTVIGRRRQSANPYAQSRSPERKKSSHDVRGPFGRFSRKESHQNLDAASSPPATGHSDFLDDRPSPGLGAPQLDHTPSSPLQIPNGTGLESTREEEEETNPTQANGVGSSSQGLQEPLQPSAVRGDFEPPKDSEGFTIPPPNHDSMQQAFAVAADANENVQPQFKVDIRNAPIAEENTGDASAAMATFANALQSQAAPRRSIGTIRNRRDRNTIIVPGTDSVPELPKDQPLSPPTNDIIPTSLSPQLDDASATPSTTVGSPALQTSPFKLSHRNTLGLDDAAGSDTHSVRSGRSLTSTTSTTIRHPEMHEPGLNSSLVEVLNATFAEGSVARASLVGEVALSFNPTDLDGPFGTDVVKIEGLSANDKLAPNPAITDPLAETAGSFSINLALVTKTTVAFKYQIHIDAEKAASQVPLVLKPQWRIEGKQADCRLTYSLSPSFPGDSISLSEFVIILHVDTSAGGKVSSCRASDGYKFRKEASLVYWKLGELTISKTSPPKTLLARFVVDGEVKPGTAEARWEVNGALGSGVSILKLEESKGKGKEVLDDEEDPFADEGGDANSAQPKADEKWRTVATVKKLKSGVYTATS